VSSFDLGSSQHDIFVSLAIQAFLTDMGGELIYSDGQLSYRNHCRPSPPNLYGYRPDAIARRTDRWWLIEVKSLGDLHSRHSSIQFGIVCNILRCNPDICYYIFVFRQPGENVVIPSKLRVFEDSDQLILVHN